MYNLKRFRNRNRGLCLRPGPPRRTQRSVRDFNRRAFVTFVTGIRAFRVLLFGNSRSLPRQRAALWSSERLTALLTRAEEPSSRGARRIFRRFASRGLHDRDELIKGGKKIEGGENAKLHEANGSDDGDATFQLDTRRFPVVARYS